MTWNFDFFIKYCLFVVNYGYKFETYQRTFAWKLAFIGTIGVLRSFFYGLIIINSVFDQFLANLRAFWSIFPNFVFFLTKDFGEYRH